MVWRSRRKSVASGRKQISRWERTSLERHQSPYEIENQMRSSLPAEALHMNRRQMRCISEAEDERPVYATRMAEAVYEAADKGRYMNRQDRCGGK